MHLVDQIEALHTVTTWYTIIDAPHRGLEAYHKAFYIYFCLLKSSSQYSDNRGLNRDKSETGTDEICTFR